MDVAVLGKHGNEEARKIGGHGRADRIPYWEREVARLVQGLAKQGIVRERREHSVN